MRVLKVWFAHVVPLSYSSYQFSQFVHCFNFSLHFFFKSEYINLIAWSSGDELPHFIMIWFYPQVLYIYIFELSATEADVNKRLLMQTTSSSDFLFTRDVLIELCTRLNGIAGPHSTI